MSAALATQPKTKAQKEAEQKKKADDERKEKEAEARRLKDEKKKVQFGYCQIAIFVYIDDQQEEEEIRKAAAKGIIINHTDSLFVPLNNRLDEDEEGFTEVTGLDSALDVMSLAVKGNAKVDEHPERRQKVTFHLLFPA